MNGFGLHPAPSTPISVRVEVKGSLDVPLQLGLLAELGDPMMEQEIIKEAVRIAVSEKLGCFDGVDVRLSTSGGREAVPAKPNGEQHQQQLGASPTATAAAAATRHSYAQRYCEAEVDLQRLGGCIEAIQGAYENLLVHVHLLNDVLHGAGPFPSPEEGCCAGAVSAPSSPSADIVSAAPPRLSVHTPSDASCGNMALTEDVNIGGSGSGNGSAASPVDLSVAYADATQRLAAARHLVETVLRDRQPDVVREAAAQHEASMLCREEDMLARERGRRLGGSEDEGGVTGDGGRPRAHHCMDHEDGVDAELRRGLLADEDDEDGAAAPLENEDERDEDDMDEETAHDRYLRQGYSPL